jgi:NNP family nitrate/nitrite transporter-like MFS transporter
MVWMMVGALANSILPDLGPLSDSRKGLMVAVPVLGGALLRLVLGPLADHLGARKTALIGLTLTLVPLLLGWLWADSYLEVLLVGLLLGVAGASFAAALPLASRWYPPQYQGLVLGIAGAGNVGTALATFFGPWVASLWGWHAAFGIALVPVLGTLALVAFLAEDGPTHAAPKTLADHAAVLKTADAGWLCFFYAITFGGFVGLVSFLAIFFRDQYALTTVRAGAFATLCALAGSLIRPLGGYLSDRLGGIRVLTWLYLSIAATMVGVSALPALSLAVVLLVTGMTLLGLGNGAVFQLAAQRFPKEIGVITGVVGAAGGARRICASERPRQPEAVDPELRRRIPGVRAGRGVGRDRPVLRRQEVGGHVPRERWGRGAAADAGTPQNAHALRGPGRNRLGHGSLGQWRDRGKTQQPGLILFQQGHVALADEPIRPGCTLCAPHLPLGTARYGRAPAHPGSSRMPQEAPWHGLRLLARSPLRRTSRPWRAA